MTFCGEVNLNSIQRGATQTGTIGSWVDQRVAGRSLVAEGVVVAAEFAFDTLWLHRLEIGIVPRNHNSRRVMEKLAIREEGVARGLVEINGVWEDHIRYGFTVEEWQERADELHLCRQVAAGVLERAHRGLQEKVRRERDVDDAIVGRREAQACPHRLVVALDRREERAVDRRAH